MHLKSFLLTQMDSNANIDHITPCVMSLHRTSIFNPFLTRSFASRGMRICAVSDVYSPEIQTLEPLASVAFPRAS